MLSGFLDGLLHLFENARYFHARETNGLTLSYAAGILSTL